MIWQCKITRPASSLENAIALQKFGVGQPVRRKEDDTLVRGKGKYTDDFSLPGQAYAWIVRSSHAHGIIRGIDTSAAKAMPGVLGVWTGTDLAAAGYGPFTCGLPLKSRDGTPLHADQPHRADERQGALCRRPRGVRGGRDAGAGARRRRSRRGRYRSPAAVTDAEEAAKPGAPQLYDHIPNNVALDYHFGDAAKVEAAFASAAHVTKLDIVNTRVAVVAMEPRAALASYDKASERYTIQVPTQGVAGNRTNLAKNILKVPNEKVHLLTANVGGSFGMKNINYPEYVCILHAAKVLGRPVKWTDERSTSFLSDSHGRAQTDSLRARARCAKAGSSRSRFRATAISAPTSPASRRSPLSLNIGKNLASVYRTPLMTVDIKTVLTNTTLMGAYRGAGRPEANYFMERLIDRAADEMGINRLTLRKRNFIKPAQMPFAASSGVTYDSGDFQGVFNKALEISDHANFAKRKKESRKRGKLRGIAVGSYLEVTAPPGVELGKIVFEDDGSVKLITGTLDYGQGHATPFAQVLCAQLGVPFESVKLEQGDSDIVHTGNGTGGSRSITASGMAIVEASKLVDRKGQARRRASDGSRRRRHRIRRRPLHHCRHRPLDRHHRTGAPPARKARCRRACPPRSTSTIPPRPVPSTFPNGCHVAEVEIDPETGDRADRPLYRRQRFRHHRQSDAGRGPIAWRRRARHRTGADGMRQLRQERPADHRLVHGLRAAARRGHSPDGSRRSPGAGQIQSARHQRLRRSRLRRQPLHLVNAVLDALSEYGITHIDMPLTPERVWRAIRDAKAKVA